MGDFIAGYWWLILVVVLVVLVFVRIRQRPPDRKSDVQSPSESAEP